MTAKKVFASVGLTLAITLVVMAVPRSAMAQSATVKLLEEIVSQLDAIENVSRLDSLSILLAGAGCWQKDQSLREGEEGQVDDSAGNRENVAEVTPALRNNCTPLGDYCQFCCYSRFCCTICSEHAECVSW
jgi:hypothetical protein